MSPQTNAMQTRTNEQWMRELATPGYAQAEAITDLRALLVRGALYSLRRTQYRLATWDAEQLRQLAEDSAQEALLAVLQHLHEFRGESRFTTWAFKFAVNKALLHARHESWKHISLEQLLTNPELPDAPFAGEPTDTDPDRIAWRTQVWELLREVIETELTPHQRRVLIAVTFDDVPLDELAQQFQTNRNAMYKTLHDARRKLKARLAARGLQTQEVMDSFAKI
jgi:RNA polymerase sigma-70 factor (ECF subfamily)